MRVVAGSARGRTLHGPPRGAEARPTSDRVREALFQILEPLGGEVVLDLYAGTGALGIEALSRGAARAIFVERDRAMLRVLARNVEELGMSGRATIVPGDVGAVLAGRGTGLSSHFGDFDASAASVDLVVVDPPYGSPARRATLEALVPWLAPPAIVALEHAARDAAPEAAGLVRTDTRRWGDTAVSFYVLAGAAPGGDTMRGEREER
jgi:16S rRNA (guanine(966)-N(2))-methyltransferase RsmD